MKVDYSPLHEPVSVTDTVDFFRWRESQKAKITFWQKKIPVRYFGAGLLVVCTVALTPMLLTLPLFSALLWVVLPIAVVLLVLIWPLLRARPQNIASESVVNYKFAKRNNFIYKEDVANPGYRGLIFQQGHGRCLDAAYYFPDGGVIGNYSYLESHGRAGSIKRTWHFASIPLPKYLPHILLVSRSRAIFKEAPRISIDLQGQTLSLEGDFNNYFTLYVSKEHAQDALYILTPDVMAALIDNVSSYDVEIVDNRLLLYREGYTSLGDASDIQRLLTVIEVTKSEINHQVHRYQ